MKLDEKLVRLRKEKGLTQLELAEAVKVSRQAVSKWESGISLPSTENLRSLSELYQVSVDDLLNDDLERFNFLKKQSAIEDLEGNKEHKKNYWKQIFRWIIILVLLLAICIAFFTIFKGKRNLQMGEIPGEEVDTNIEGDFDIIW